MCGRFALYTPEKIISRFHVSAPIKNVLEARYNIAPGQHIPVITEQNNRVVLSALWGLRPPWEKSNSPLSPLINIRSESLLEKRGMQSLLFYRCLIPANGFYEWVKNEEGKQPYYFFQSGQLMISFAGIYQILGDHEGHQLVRCAIITTGANDSVIRYHQRMPFILSQKDESSWINPVISKDEQKELLRNPPLHQLEVRQVSRDVNSPRNDYPRLIELQE